MAKEASAADSEIIALFTSRDGIETVVKTNSGAVYSVYNIAWGYDLGDDHAHVTTNVSPDVDGASFDVFSTADLIEILDGPSGSILYRAP
jgi:hypothetical protein